jgi:hypothetical protein
MPIVEDQLHIRLAEHASDPSLARLPFDVQRDYLDWIENHPITAYQRRWRMNTFGSAIIALALMATHIVLHH